MTASSRAFVRAITLAELLVTVAAIALPVCILLPALAHAKAPARRSMCADNMRRLAEGMFSYASDHQGKGPLRGWFSYSIAESSKEVYGWGGSDKVLANLGMLHPKRTAGEHDRLYCPETYALFRDGATGWHTAFDSSVRWTPGSYNYATVLGQRIGAAPTLAGPDPFPRALWSSAFTSWVQLWEQSHPGQTFQVPDSPALAFDMFVGGIKPSHGGGVNVLYTDGHLRHHDIGVTAVGSNDSRQYDMWYKLSLKQ